MTQSATQLVDVDVAADVAADAADDVAADVGHDVMMTSSLTRLRPDPTNPDFNPTRTLTRPGQRSTPDPVNITQQPVHALPHAPSLLVAREGACEGIFGQF